MKRTSLLVVLMVVGLLAACAPAATPTPAAAPGSGAAAALTVTGAVEKSQSLSMDALKSMSVVKIKAEHPKLGVQEYEGVRLNAVLDLAKPTAAATKLALGCADGYTAEVTLADVRKCADCLLAFNAGMLDAVMPGMVSGSWAKQVVKIEAK